jgi:flagellar biogenesis protein FliO
MEQAMTMLWLASAVPDVSGGSSLLDFIKVTVVLSGIVLLAWAGLKLWLPKIAGIRPLRTDLIEVVARQPLEARKTLYVVRAGSQHLLLASSGDAVTLLREVPIDIASGETVPATAGFAQKLRQLRSQGQ